jgi:uncharacterized protein YbjT (DUF2867 family)
MSKAILVTGITGQIGGELARLLASAGADVRGLTRDPSKARASAGRVRLVQGDLEQPTTLGPALEGVESAFFMGPAGPKLREAAKQFFSAARRAGVHHVVALSSGTIEIAPRPQIGRWHMELEEELEASGLPKTVLRPGSFASNVLGWAHMIRGQGSVFHPYADARSAPIDPRDIAAVAFAALTEPNHLGETYALTGPEVLTTREQVEVLASALGKPIRLVEVPEAGARKGMMSSGMPEMMADAILELVRAASQSKGFKTSHVLDVTGKEARSFREWVRDNLPAFA